MPCVHAKWPNLAGRDSKVSEETKHKLTSQHSEPVFQNIGVNPMQTEWQIFSSYITNLIPYLPEHLYISLINLLIFWCRKATSTQDDTCSTAKSVCTRRCKWFCPHLLLWRSFQYSTFFVYISSCFILKIYLKTMCYWDVFLRLNN